MRKFLTILLSIVLMGVYVQSNAQEELQVTGPASATRLTFQSIEENKLLVSTLDNEGNPILGLQPQDFQIIKGRKNAQILSVEPLETSKKIGLNIVLVVDNSFSMKQRKAVQSLLSALEEFYSIVRPMDNIHAVVFDQKNTIDVDGRKLHARTFQSSNVSELRNFFKQSFFDNLTNGTFLYDGMAVGLDIIRKMPDKANKFMVVFSDGKDINSAINESGVQAIAKGIPNFSAYCLDFTQTKSMDAFLKAFAEKNNGKIWKAASSTELLPIFKEFSTTLLHRYIVSYRFLTAPEGSLALEPSTLTIEEVTTIDSSPLLNYVFFAEGQSDIGDPYILFAGQSDTRSFAEEKLRGSMEKYHHLLNIIGRRLTDNPDAKITLVGCNSNKGAEKGNQTLSRSRAESIKAYLRYIWAIDPSRMDVKAQNLPTAPSTSYVPEGVAENQRVEIHSEDPAILDTIQSTYVQEMSSTKTIRMVPKIESEAGVATWKLYLLGNNQSRIGTASGEGNLAPAYEFDLATVGLDKIASFQSITAGMEVSDKEGEVFVNETAASMKVKYIKRQERMAQKMGYRVLEKYALILFDYNSDAIKARNKVIVDRIIERMKAFPSAQAKIVGHTDNIGKDEYNLNLSERRAKAVFEQMVAAGMVAGENVTYAGAGPHDPLYDNTAPEGRALNRTVTVTLEYQKEG